MENTPAHYQDPALEEQWCMERQAEVMQHLKQKNLPHGRVGEWPAWHIPPYVSIWAIESATEHDEIGYWVICGELTPDSVAATHIFHPRDALQAFAKRWRKRALQLQNDNKSAAIPANLAKEIHLLKERAAILLDWAQNKDMWEEAEEDEDDEYGRRPLL